MDRNRRCRSETAAAGSIRDHTANHQLASAEARACSLKSTYSPDVCIRALMTCIGTAQTLLWPNLYFLDWQKR
eukprot:5685827-Amphidinium_carterae.1